MDYVDERGRNPIQDWLGDQLEVPVKARVKIQRILLSLKGTKLWMRPLASNLDGYAGIVEIRVRWMNIQYRILGFRGPADMEFTLLFPAKEQGDQFVPLSAPSIAQSRMRVVKADRRRICEHRFN